MSTAVGAPATVQPTSNVASTVWISTSTTTASTSSTIEAMRVAVTGANGVVGRALLGQLRERAVEVTALDLPEHDARDLAALVATTGGHDVLVHLAWKDPH